MKVRAKNKKQYWIYTGLFMLLGGVVGFMSSVYSELLIGFFRNMNHLDSVYGWISIFFSVCFVGCALAAELIYNKYKRISASIDEDEVYEKANRYIDLTSILNLLAVVFGFSALAMIHYMVEIVGVYSLISCVLFLIVIIRNIILNQKLAKALQDMLGIDPVNIYDEKEMANLASKMDEGAKSILYEASYNAYRKLSGLMIVLVSIVSLATMILDIDASYILLVTMITVIVYGINFYEAWILEHKGMK